MFNFRHLASLVLFIIFCCALTNVVLSSSKYSEKANSKDKNDLDFASQERPFRMLKINLLWEKAKKKLSSVKLADLYADLVIQDKQEAHLKKVKADKLDKDGSLEAKVLTSYQRIVDQYGLTEFYSNNEIPKHKWNEKDTEFRDPKLQSMWRRAEEAGFSEKDLNMLKEEFMHQQMKIEEYDFVHRELDNVANPNDNTIDREQKNLDYSETESEERKAAKKKAKKELNYGYIRLEHLTSSLMSEEPMFKDARVHKLWALAKKTNWTEEELNSFKGELKHFEHRLLKQDYYKEQLEMSQEALKSSSHEGGEILEKHQHLEEKHKLINTRVNKFHSELQSRLEKALQHSEL
ncbi:alpha-2-macroglobulin receptor-associated protein-like [Physella acuta]|uniref:alpha-2-macroglobulin receptor-associated protein-like n=1 Tax=Physella acuta TaxID=109671 RepID=UPI0027DE72DA|nr:alpha-2-macroglobulin receptor-associated protein-like [Physella acuta]